MLILGATLGVLALYDTSADPEPELLALAAPTPDDVAVSPLAGEEPVVEELAVKEPVVEEPVAVLIHLESEPSGAQVEEGGALLGKTPLPVSFASAEAPARELTLTLRQHEPLTLTLSPDTVSPSRHALPRVKRTTQPSRKPSESELVKPSQPGEETKPPVDKKPPGILLPE